MKTPRALVAIMVLVASLSASLLEIPAAYGAGRADLQGLTVVKTSDGRLWAVWSADDGQDTDLLYSRWDGRDWSPAGTVVANAGTWEQSPSLAVAADGTVWVSWVSESLQEGTLYVSRWLGYRWANAALVPIGQASRPRQPVLAAFPSGEMLLAWVGFDGTDDEIFASHWDGRTWSVPERVGRDDSDPWAYDTQPRLAVGPDGSAVLAWTGYVRFLDDKIFVARWDDQRWTDEEQVSADDDTVDADPSPAVTADGTVWLVWHGRAAQAPDAGRRIHVARWLPFEGWSHEEIISSLPGSDVMEEQPSLALDASGHPFVTWLIDGGTRGVGYASFDSTRWSSPRWVVQNAVVDSICLPGVAPEVVSWLENAANGFPLSQVTLDGSQPPLPLFEPPARLPGIEAVVANRHLAFGDSITWGGYVDPATGQPVGPYPSRLEPMLDTRVVASEVINAGVPGEETPPGMNRLKQDALPAYIPEFVEIMEGTNDMTRLRPYNQVAENLTLMVQDSKRFGSHPLLSTLLPRKDSFNDETHIMNSYIADVAARTKVPLVDNWQAFMAYGDLWSLYSDNLHPNGQGMAVLTNSWYHDLLNSYLSEETTPPTTWIESVQGQCGQVTARWNGSDNLSWVVGYDVQAQVNGGAWTDWLQATPDTSGAYSGGSYGDTVGFRVRGRDVVGNQSDWSTPASIQIADGEPPYQVQVNALPFAQTSPFRVRWSAADACGQVVAYDVATCVGIGCTDPATWPKWLTSTPEPSALFDPASPQYGQTYSFSVRALDQAGNWSVWSAPVSTILARLTLSGQILTVRHEPVIGAQVVVTGALVVEPKIGGYVAYMAEAGNYDLSASRDGFRTLPPMHILSATADINNLDFVLPPLDDVVQDGGFESGTWGNWLPGGTSAPMLVTGAHTGDGAAVLGSTGETSSLSQSVSLPIALTNATLSFLVRLDDDADVSSTLRVELTGTPIRLTQVVTAGGWLHVWLPADAALGRDATLTFTVIDSPAVRLDEVSLGSALSGGSVVYLPLMRVGASGLTARSVGGQ